MMLGVFAAKTTIQMVGNPLQRWVRGEATNSNQAFMDEASGLVSAAIQLGPDGDEYVLSHIAQAVAAIMDGSAYFNSNPNVTLIPAKGK